MGRASKGRDYDYDTYRESIFLTQYCGCLCHIRKHGSNCRFIGPVYIGVFLAKNSLIKGMSFTASATGGKYYHTLTTDEMPSHYHNIAHLWTGSKGATMARNEAMISGYPEITNKGEYGKDTVNVGGSKAHNNVMPYISIYFWKRTA